MAEAKTQKQNVTANLEVIVQAIYAALASGDAEGMSQLVAVDLEWWFHGPPSQRHLMRMLTGVDRLGTYNFVPERLSTIGVQVFAEGKSTTAKSKACCWVHVWTVKDGRVVELRECFNTSVTVTGNTGNIECRVKENSSSYNAYSSSHGLSTGEATLWQSELMSGLSMPGLVLAI